MKTARRIALGFANGALEVAAYVLGAALVVGIIMGLAYAARFGWELGG